LQEAAPPSDPFSRHVTHRKNDPQHHNRNCRLAESQIPDPTPLNPEDVFPHSQSITSDQPVLQKPAPPSNNLHRRSSHQQADAIPDNFSCRLAEFQDRIPMTPLNLLPRPQVTAWPVENRSTFQQPSSPFAASASQHSSWQIQLPFSGISGS
jgi:hypothetical protein